MEKETQKLITMNQALPLEAVVGRLHLSRKEGVIGMVSMEE